MANEHAHRRQGISELLLLTRLRPSAYRRAMLSCPTIRIIALVALGLGLSAVNSNAQEPEKIRTFHDWTIGCDNFSRCTALGFPVEGAAGGSAYLKIVRDGKPDAKPQIKVVAVIDKGGDENGKRELKLSLPNTMAKLGINTVEANDEGSYAAGPISGDPMPFLSALLPSAELVVSSKDMSDAAHISLRGLAAALRAMDDHQGRADNVSALVARGTLGLDAVPQVPSTPAPVEAVRLSELDPVPPLPKGIESPSEECDANSAPIAYETTTGSRIFGTCAYEGAYNVGRHYTLVHGSEIHALAFDAGFGQDDDKSILANAELDENGLTISSFDKGRGVGDCGAASSWAFDGAAFRLVSFSAMTDCRGALPEDWPVLYTGSLSSGSGR